MANDNYLQIIHPDNSIEIVTNIPGLRTNFCGRGSIISLYAPIPKFANCNIEMGDYANFILGSSRHWIKNFNVWRMRPGSKITIGSMFSCVSAEFTMQCEDGLQVTIGDDCMFSHDIRILPSDAHAIISLETGRALNHGSSIVIGNHVWLCPYTTVNKGVSIADNCICGSFSVVNKSIVTSNTLHVGNPLRMIKSNITWDRSSAQDYEKRMGFNKD